MSVGYLIRKPVVAPSDIAVQFQTGVSGKLATSLLVSIGPSGQLHHTAARAYKALAFKCLSIGLPLTYTYGGTYRSYAMQLDLMRQRTDPGYIKGRKRYYTDPVTGMTRSLKLGVAGVAAPGQSNHGWGLAVDYAFDGDVRDGIGPDDAKAITDHPQWLQFKIWAVECGFSWEDPEEPWHLRYVAGDAIPQLVLDVERYLQALATNTLPPPSTIPRPTTPAPTPVLTPTSGSKLMYKFFKVKGDPNGVVLGGMVTSESPDVAINVQWETPDRFNAMRNLPGFGYTEAFAKAAFKLSILDGPLPPGWSEADVQRAQ